MFQDHQLQTISSNVEVMNLSISGRHFHSGYCPLSLPSWHDNMKYQAPSFVDRRRRIGRRENYYRLLCQGGVVYCLWA